MDLYRAESRRGVLLGPTFQGVIIKDRTVISQIVQKRITQGIMVQGRLYVKAFKQSRVVDGLLVRTKFSK